MKASSIATVNLDRLFVDDGESASNNFSGNNIGIFRRESKQLNYWSLSDSVRNLYLTNTVSLSRIHRTLTASRLTIDNFGHLIL